MVDASVTSAVRLAGRIRSGKRSPIDVIDACLERISDRNDRTNAFVTLAEETAREAARDAERAVENGDDLGPLHGVPVAVKDLNATAGIRTTFGSPLFADTFPTPMTFS